jgi:hypothetical protein
MNYLDLENYQNTLLGEKAEDLLLNDIRYGKDLH